MVMIWTLVVTLPFSSSAVQVTLVSPRRYFSGASFVTVTGNRSVASADPMETGVSRAAASTTISFGIFKTGGVVSTTVTFCLYTEELRFSSVAVQMTAVWPSGKSAGAFEMTPVTLKISVAAGVSKRIPVFRPAASTVRSAGFTISGAVVSTTVMVCVLVEMFPLASVAFQVITVLPRE